MKKIILAVLCTICGTSTIPAQIGNRAITLSGGIYSPKDLRTSYIVGGQFTFKFMPLAEIGIGVDYYGRHETDELILAKDITIGTVKVTEIQTNSEQIIHVVPAHVILMFKFPVLANQYVYLSGTAGYAYLYSKLKAYTPELLVIEKDYHGFKWSIGAGFLYRFSQYYAVSAELSYLISTTSHPKKMLGPPVNCVVDISGIVLRVGLRHGFF